MIAIVNINSERFSFNGIPYYKNFMGIVGGDYVHIVNIYDSKIALTKDGPVKYDEITVNGNSFASAVLLQSALLPVLYTRGTLGGGGGVGNLQQVTENGNETDQPIVFKDINAFADWRLQIDVGEFWLYRHDGTNFQEKFRIETEGISFFDDDGNFKFWLKKPASGTSNLVAPETTGEETIATRPWVESQIDSAVVGLLDDRGNWNPADGLFPNIGGSGTGGAVLKGDLWTISASGTIGGVAVTVGDVIRALVDSPGQTASNWSISENNLGYVPENSANKSTSTDDSASSVKFPVWSAIVSYFTYSRILSILGFTPLNKAGDTITGDVFNTATGFLQVPSGTTAQRPVSPQNGMLRYNSTTLRHEFYADGAWRNNVRLESWVDISLTSTITGWSVITIRDIEYLISGNICHVYGVISGTSNSGEAKFTLPFNYTGIRSLSILSATITNNGINQTTPGLIRILQNTNEVLFYINGNLGAFQNTNTKQIIFNFSFKIN